MIIRTKPSWADFILIAMALLSTNNLAHSATVSLLDTTITIEGRLLDADADQVIGLGYGKPITHVIFKESTGGQWRAGQRIGSWLSGRDITTVVDGFCGSSCAMAFLGGRKREFSKTTPHSMLAFHGAFSPVTHEPVVALQDAWFDWIERRTGKPVDPTFSNFIKQIRSPAGAVYFVDAGSGAERQIHVYGCVGDEKKQPANCARLPTVDAVALGFITH